MQEGVLLLVAGGAGRGRVFGRGGGERQHARLPDAKVCVGPRERRVEEEAGRTKGQAAAHVEEGAQCVVDGVGQGEQRGGRLLERERHVFHATWEELTHSAILPACRTLPQVGWN